MPTAEEWTTTIQSETAAVLAVRPPRIVAPIERLNGFSSPVLARADDRNTYVVKGLWPPFCEGRDLFADQVVARIGEKYGAPVGPPCLVTVSDALTVPGSYFEGWTPGTAHATRYLNPVSPDREDIKHIDEPMNRGRFALLAVLYGWCGANDHQFVYGHPPHIPLVYSVDHGNFLGGCRWTVGSLQRLGEAEPDPVIVSGCALQSVELQAAQARLGGITVIDICRAVAYNPPEWGIAIDEQVAVADWLWTRRDQLLSA